ncbi:hypothetical protein BH10BDE1_BH10BDE1_17500 [soil metagenome]
MSNEPNPTSQMTLRVPLEWLESGWILERLSETAESASDGPTVENFVIGGGVCEVLAFDDLERASVAVWSPHFFPNQVAPLASKWSRQISRAELLKWLSENFLGSTIPSKEASNVNCSKVNWLAPEKSGFEAAFKRIQTAFREEGVKKAVPAVFASGLTAASDRRAWLADRLRAGLEGTASNKLRLYGLWDDQRGFLGATPEALFTIDGSKISSMAVAGTRALSTLGADASNPKRVEKFVDEFERDPKERNEHDVVAADIASVFDSLGVSVTRSKTRVEKFGALFHLVTDFVSIGHGSESQKPNLGDLVRALHPTPALGTSPRDVNFKLLREAHELGAGGNARENFGAPFVVKVGDRVDALVAIRQIRWSGFGSDRFQVAVGSGCGIVPESDVDREWNELAAKRAAVMKLFRLSPETSRPVFWSLEVLQKILSLGVRRFVVCAGARNAPLVVAIEALRRAAEENPSGPAIIVESFFEERSAAFYAMGLARSLEQPVAVVTTSGTATAELLPAMVEADFSGVALVSVTADRPRRLRFSGAPQAIPQDQIFNGFVERAWDLEEGDAFDFEGVSASRRPLHLNVCLEEPLLKDAESHPELLRSEARKIVASLSVPALAKGVSVTAFDASNSQAALAAKLKAAKLVAIVGGLLTNERSAVADFLAGHAIPCLLEATSGLRGDSRLATIELTSGDRYLQKYILSGAVEHVLRLGGVPTTRVWRDLDDVGVSAQTLSISRLRFSGLARGQFIHLAGDGEFADFLRAATPRQAKSVTETARAWLGEDRAASLTLDKLLARRPNSEAGFVRRLSEIIPAHARVYVGNSLPIRWWDLAATRAKATLVEANRGVNGIDGQLSTAFGLAAGPQPGAVTDTPKKSTTAEEMWILVGDLTAMYDLAAPWALLNGRLVDRDVKIRMVVLNNSGGRIFKRVLSKAPGGSAPFENEHTLDFKNWAAMWKLGYARVMSHDDLNATSKNIEDHMVIEIVPSEIETAQFWTELV